jgi:hypothetical protein
MLLLARIYLLGFSVAPDRLATAPHRTKDLSSDWILIPPIRLRSPSSKMTRARDPERTKKDESAVWVSY